MSQPDDHARAYLLFDPAELKYQFGEGHPIGTQGFVEHETTEPDISMEPGNILLVRVGKNVDKGVVRQFFNHVTQKPGFIRKDILFYLTSRKKSTLRT